MAGPLIVQLGDCTVACSYMLPHQRGENLLQQRLSEAYGDAKDCDGMNSRSETLFLTVSDLSGYEVRQFQMIVTFLR